MTAVRPPLKRGTGFTLIELLVVIAIIAILAAILFPVFARAREQARKSTCTSNLKQFGNAFLMYKQDYDERYPLGGWWDRGTRSSEQDWHQSLMPYIKNGQVYECPSSTDIHQLPLNRYDWNRTATDYLYNNQLASGRNAVPDSAVAAPADCVELIEGHQDWGGGQCITPFSAGRLVDDVWCREYSTWGNRAELVTSALWGSNTRVWGQPRHNGTINVLFCDGHVKSVNTGEMVGSAQGLAKLRAVLPFSRNMNPAQNGGDWYADP